MTKTQLEELILEAIENKYVTFELIAAYIETKLDISRFKQAKFRKFLKIVLPKFVGLRSKYIIVSDDNEEKIVKVYYFRYDTVEELIFFKDDNFKNINHFYKSFDVEKREFINRTISEKCLKYNTEEVARMYENVLKLKKFSFNEFVYHIKYSQKIKYNYKEITFGVINLPKTWIENELDNFLDDNNYSAFDIMHCYKNSNIEENFCILE